MLGEDEDGIAVGGWVSEAVHSRRLAKKGV
jgi:hypothetical protein